MIASDVIEEIRHDGDLTDGRFTDASLLFYLNSALRKIQVIGFTALPKDHLFSKRRRYVSNNFNRYAMPSDILTEKSVYSIYDQDNQRLRKVRNVMEPGEMEYALTGTGWISGGGWRTATMVYCREIERIRKLEERLPLPAAFREYLVFYCIKRAKAADAAGNEVAVFLEFTNRQKEEMLVLFQDMGRDDADLEITEPSLFT